MAGCLENETKERENDSLARVMISATRGAGSSPPAGSRRRSRPTAVHRAAKGERVRLPAFKMLILS